MKERITRSIETTAAGSRVKTVTSGAALSLESPGPARYYPVRER